jgi:hypothetical protein
VGLRVGLDTGERINSLSLPGIEPSSPGRVVCSQTIMTELPRLHFVFKKTKPLLYTTFMHTDLSLSHKLTLFKYHNFKMLRTLKRSSKQANEKNSAAV